MNSNYNHIGFCLGEYDSIKCGDCPTEAECLNLKDKFKICIATDTEEQKNYCSPNRLFSKCTAGKKWNDHKKCRFSIKATHADRCMYFNSDTDHCDNLDAIKNLK